MEIKRKLYFTDLYEDVFYSKDMMSTQIIIEMEPENGDGEIVSSGNIETINKIRALLDSKDENGNFEYLLAGEEYVTLSIKNFIINDLIIIIPLLLIALLLILYLAFNKPGGMILPLITVVISCIWTIGIMSLLGAPFNLGSSVIPVFLLAIGTAYSIHLLNHYYLEIQMDKEESISIEQHKSYIHKSIKKVGIPIFLTALSTAVGFGSLAFSGAGPIRDLGIFTSIGVITALIITLVFIPSMLSLKKGHLLNRKNLKPKKNGLLKHTLDFLYRHIYKSRKVLFLIIIAIIIFSAIGIFNIQIGQPAIEFFKPDSEIRKADEFVNENLAGSTIINVLIEGMENDSLNTADTSEEFSDEQFELPGSEINDSDFVLPGEDSTNITDDDFTLPGNEPDETSSEEKDSKTYNSIKNPELLKAMDELAVYLLNKYPQIRKMNSFSDLIKEFNMVMHGDSKMEERNAQLTGNDFIAIIQNAYIRSDKTDISASELTENILYEMGYGGRDYYEIPYDPEKYNLPGMEGLQNLISQYLLLYSGDDADNLIDNIGNPIKTRMYMMLNTPDPKLYRQIKSDILAFAEINIEPLGYTVKTAGTQDLIIVLNDLIVNGQFLSLIVALAIVFLIISIDYKSISAGIIALFPIICTLLLNFGIMGWLNIPLDVITATVASITIGIGIDYAIHFLSAFKKHLKDEKDIDTAVKNVLSTTGKAIVTNSVSVAIGFLILLFSQFVPLNTLGLLITVTMICSALLSLTLLPAIIKAVKPRFIYKS